jgi:DNA-binding PadR family transcriptional regulator
MIGDKSLKGDFEKEPPIPSNIYLAILYVLNEKPDQTLSDIQESLFKSGYKALFGKRAALGTVAMCVARLDNNLGMVAVSGQTKDGRRKYSITHRGRNYLSDPKIDFKLPSDSSPDTDRGDPDLVPAT